MQRLIARLLLSLALVGNLAPLMLATTAPPPHACCFRKGIHRCHDSVAADSTELVVRAASCCHQDCCRAVTTARWAQAQKPASCLGASNVEAYLLHQDLVAQNNGHSRFHSTRAPPAPSRLFS